MPSKLEWAFALLDKTTGPATAIEKKLKAVEQQLKRVDAATRAHGSVSARESVAHQRALTSGTESWVTKLNMALGVVGAIGGAMRTIGGLAIDAGSAMGRVAYEFGKAGVEAASFKESAMISFKRLLGSKGAAEGMFNQSIDFAARTPFETKEVLGWTRGLLLGGFKQGEIQRVLTAVGDLAAVNDFDRQVVDRISMSLRQIKGKGKLQGEELMQLAEAGVSSGKVYDVLGQMLGVQRDRVLKLMQAGKITADTGVNAVLKVIEAQVGGSMNEFSQSVPGLLSTLKSRPFELLLGVDKTGGFASFKGALKNLTDVLDAKSEAGKRVAKAAETIFDRMFGSIFGDLGGANGIKNSERLVTGLLGGIERVVAVGRVAANVVLGLISGITGDGELLLDLTKPLDEKTLATMSSSARDFGLAMGQAAKDIGTIAAGLAEISSLVMPLSWLPDVFKAGASASVAATGLPGIQNAMHAFQTPNVQPGSAVGNVSVNAPVTIDARGATADDAKKIGEAVKNAQGMTLSRALSLAATSSGVHR